MGNRLIIVFMVLLSFVLIGCSGAIEEEVIEDNSQQENPESDDSASEESVTEVEEEQINLIDEGLSAKIIVNGVTQEYIGSVTSLDQGENNGKIEYYINTRLYADSVDKSILPDNPTFDDLGMFRKNLYPFDPAEHQIEDTNVYNHYGEFIIILDENFNVKEIKLGLTGSLCGLASGSREVSEVVSVFDLDADNERVVYSSEGEQNCGYSTPLLIEWDISYNENLYDVR